MKNLTQADVARLECALEVVRSDRADAHKWRDQDEHKDFEIQRIRKRHLLG